ncbi:hypothetical protein yc1106_04954 [Curvularia clavata]|uniref:Uncharacterized protein n=1 Tax=Curvularia clavata TaxID=95742 RepID=A0A9Q9DT60_CURCL|nr:hypothetical protein yc1106_04954 [Curvularia clavata]
MYEDHEWEHLARMFSDRFRRMITSCDFANDHKNESSQTLSLTCVILWFKLDGGKDEFLRLRMTVFRRHPLRFSIGRAVHVEPGSTMITGWSAKYPESLSQYDDARRTITMETWMMNRGKSFITPSPAAFAAWKEVILAFPQKSKFWDDYPPNFELGPLTWPRNWRFTTFSGIVSEEDLDSMDASNDEDTSEISDVDLPEDDEELSWIEDEEEEEARYERASQVAHSDDETGKNLIPDTRASDSRRRDLPMEIPDSEEDFPDFSHDLQIVLQAFGATEHEENPLLALDRVDDDDRFLQSLAHYLPQGVRERYEMQKIERFSLFQSAITKLGKEARLGYCFRIDKLARAEVPEWQQYEAAIDVPFTEEEKQFHSFVRFASRYLTAGTRVP